MRSRNDRDLGFGEQVDRVQAIEVVDRPVHDRHIGAAAAHKTDLLADLTQQNVDVRNIAAPFGFGEKLLQQLMRRPGLRREHERSVSGPCSPRPMSRSLHRLDHDARFRGEHTSGIGERNSTTIALEEPHTESRLQLPDRPRQRGLRYAETSGGAGEVQFLGNREEVAQLTRFKISHVGYRTADTLRVSQPS